jgi:hypothetical protein
LAADRRPIRFRDGPLPPDADDGMWRLRAPHLRDAPWTVTVLLASVAGPVQTYRLQGSRVLALGPVGAVNIGGSVVVCDGPVYGQPTADARDLVAGDGAANVGGSVLVCRGNVKLWMDVKNSVIFADGDVDLSWANKPAAENCVIRASGTVRVSADPTRRPINCTIEERVKNPTAPYAFFELADVGLSVTDDEEGMVVTRVTPDSPFGLAGLAKGDVILALDDAAPGHSERLRKAVRRALVRHGDCLITVARGAQTLDVPVFFPLPK